MYIKLWQRYLWVPWSSSLASRIKTLKPKSLRELESRNVYIGVAKVPMDILVFIFG